MAARSADIVQPAGKLGDDRCMLLPGFFPVCDLLP
jgi:hypothetical protein